MKVKLSKKFIDSVAYASNGTDIYMDEVLTGFALRVGKQSKRYTLHKRINGKLYRDEVEETLTHAVKSVEPNLGDFNYAA
ncbi:MAG: hypothetical protein L0G63_12420 [Psychrobacter sp.]|uniref:hypothetical protein n=1 Tax=Psychrobacter sp. TaxID=56811 RepID=UPI0026484182|nr:hypothetical protein [Psychrobacter sp.]MDN5621256.1 hypothetical protein [Psychrobacter sp.]